MNHPPPSRPTPTWVWLTAGGIVVAALVAVVLVFVLHGSSTTTADPTDTASTTSVASSVASPTDDPSPTSSAADENKPSEADVNAGILTILTKANPGSFSGEQLQKITNCATPQFMQTMSAETLQNYAEAKDVEATADKGKAGPIIQKCVKEL